MKKNIAIAVLAAALVDVHLANSRAIKSIKKMGEVLDYFADVLDKNGIEFTEFDRLAVMSFVD